MQSPAVQPCSCDAAAAAATAKHAGAIYRVKVNGLDL